MRAFFRCAGWRSAARKLTIASFFISFVREAARGKVEMRACLQSQEELQRENAVSIFVSRV
ncbi:hypothetical protein D6817_03685 [Candidatus Pacearchaeota archaeon]|nr:MAG: hypothetical protein D6817_03685 [Candidatus Pacearchaeota archaeon]